MNSESSLLVSHLPVLTTLITGLLIAFAFQLLLTSFGVAAGVTALGYLPDSATAETESPADTQPEEEKPFNPGDAVGKVGFAVGAGSLLTVNTVLFVACFLAVKLSLVADVVLGAVLGIVIWSGYFLIVAWVSSKAAGSVVGAIVSTISSGIGGLMSTVTAALVRKQDLNQLPKALRAQAAATESVVGTLKQQLDQNSENSTLSVGDVQELIRDYVKTLQPPKLDVEAIRSEVAKVVTNSELTSLSKEVAHNPLSQVDRQTLFGIVSSRTDFSKQDIKQVVDALESVWHEVLGADKMTGLTDFLSSATPDELTSDELNNRLAQLHQSDQPEETTGSTLQQNLSQLDPKQLGKRMLQTVLSRVDLSDLDVSKILSQVPALTDTDQSQSDSKASFNPIKADVADFLLNAYPWHLTRKTVKLEFQDVIYDPEANPGAVRQQLLPVDRSYIESLLEQREDLTSAKIKKIAERLEEVRQDVLETLTAAEAEEQSKLFTTQVASYLGAVKPSVRATNLQQQLKTLLQKSEPDIHDWPDRLLSLTHETVMQMLHDRQELSETQVEQLTEQIETARDQLIAEVKDLQTNQREAAKDLWSKLEQYIRDRSQKLTARNIQRQLKSLIQESKAELAALQSHLPPFDSTVVEGWLRERQDLSDKQIRRVTTQVEKAWSRLIEVPKAALTSTQATVDRALTALTDYVQETDWSTANLSDLPQDLLDYLQRHQVGLEALSAIALVDWKSLFEQFMQRQDLTEAQRQQILQHIQQTIYRSGKLPRRLALRTQRNLQNVQETLIDYLRHTDRDDLEPEQLQRSIAQLVAQLLNNSQQQFMSSGQALLDRLTTPSLADLQTHLSLPDRAGLVALLSERGDLTDVEASQIADQIEVILRQAVERVQGVRQQMQQAMTSVSDKLRQYLTSLELPEPDYDRIKQDLQQLLITPQAGVEALSGSLGETLHNHLKTFNREAMAGLLKARDDISESLSQQLIDRIDAVRLSALDQVESLQLAVKQQMEDLKQQAQHQAEETRKAIATAAWWLFGTAFTSIVSSAIAGALAVGGFSLIGNNFLTDVVRQILMLGSNT